MAEADVDVVLKSIHDPQLCLSSSASHHWRCWHGRAGNRTSLRGGPSSGSCPKRYGRQRSGSSSWHALTTSQKCMPTCCHSWLTSPHWPRLPTPRPSTWSWRQQLNRWFRSNIPECYLSLVQDPPPKTTAEECLSQLEKVLLPQPLSLTQEPQYAPTRLLAAAVWLHLKCKFFNGGTTKEACTMFEVWAKQLSKLLSGKVYLGGSAGAAKGKHKWSHTTACEGDVAGDEPPSLSPPPRSKHHRHQQ